MDLEKNDYATGVWKMLDELAESNPAKYKQFISEQMQLGKQLHQPPIFREIYKGYLVNGQIFYVNMCEWEAIQAPASDSDSIPIISGDVYIVNAVETICLAFNPIVFDQHGFKRIFKLKCSLTKKVLTPCHLLAISLTYLAKEKKVIFKDYINLVEKDQLPTFCATSNSSPHGGEKAMLQSLSFKDFSMTGIDTSGDANTNILTQQLFDSEMKIELCQTKVKQKSHNLIEEIKSDNVNNSKPEWRLEKTNTLSCKSYSLYFTLPANTRLSDCELDISEKQISLKLKNNDTYKETFVTAFPTAVNSNYANAKLIKKTNTLKVLVPTKD